jgi:hypothetical protein
VHRPRKLLISCLFFGVGHSRMDSSFSRSAVIPSGDRICPRYVLSSFWNLALPRIEISMGCSECLGTFSAGWASVLGTCAQSWSHRPGTRDVSHKWGLLKRSPLTPQTSLERCRGIMARLWPAVVLDPSRLRSSPWSDGDPPVKNRSSGTEWRNILPSLLVQK